MTKSVLKRILNIFLYLINERDREYLKSDLEEIYEDILIKYGQVYANFWFFASIDREYKEDDFWWKGYMARLIFNKDNKAEDDVIPVDFGPDTKQIREIKGNDRNEFLEYLK